MKTQILYLVLILALILNFLSEGKAILIPKTGEKPNIIMIVTDDQGYHDLGCYGAKDIITPNIDRLANEGARLTNFYVTSSICTPSRGSILTGRYPQRNGTYELFRNEKPDYGYEYSQTEYSTTPERILGTDLREIFISEILEDSGYVNGIFGKWDLGQLKRFLPLQQGFHEFYGFVNTGIDYFTHERYGVPSMYINNEPTEKDKGTYSTDLFEREALRFIKENKGTPFFLYLPFNAPHSASNLDKEIRRSVQAPESYLEKYPVTGTTLKDKQRREYMAAMTRVDDAVGRIMTMVKEYDIDKNTIVIFFSDNGGGMGSDNSPFRGRKSQFLEGGIRVPCIVKWPARIDSGVVVDDFLSSLELFPTILEAADIDKPDSIILDGFNMLPVLERNESTQRNEMFWELRGDYAARLGDFKWVQTQKNHGLYDLSKDSGESHDLSKVMPVELEKVKTAFFEWQREMDKVEPRRPFKDF